VSGIVAVAAAACSESTEPAQFEVIEEVEFHVSLGVDLQAMTRTASGMYYQDLVVGDGALAEPGSEVSVYYVGRYRSGETFDSNVGRTALTFVVDEGGIIDGFNEGVRGMRVGGQRKIVIPPELAYGTPGPRGIMIFDIELADVQAP
jgi:FKBP-type peptidyl-prolyl cis-trans isomerase